MVCLQTTAASLRAQLANENTTASEAAQQVSDAKYAATHAAAEAEAARQDHHAAAQALKKAVAAARDLKEEALQAQIVRCARFV